LRRLIHDTRQARLGVRGLRDTLDGCELALVLVPANVIVDATPQYDAVSKTEQVSAWAPLHFWNAELFCTPPQAQALIEAFGAVDKDDRRRFFEAALFARRRTRTSWTGTPIRTLFLFEDAAASQRFSGLVARLCSAMLAKGYDLVSVCEAIDQSGDGYLSADELYETLSTLEASLTRQDVLQMMTMMDLDDDRAIKYSEFHALFAADGLAAPKVADSGPSGGAGTGLGKVSLLGTRTPKQENQPSRVREAQKERETREVEEAEVERSRTRKVEKRQTAPTEVPGWKAAAKEVVALVSWLPYSTGVAYLAYLYKGKDASAAAEWLGTAPPNDEESMETAEGDVNVAALLLLESQYEEFDVNMVASKVREPGVLDILLKYKDLPDGVDVDGMEVVEKAWFYWKGELLK